MARGVISVKGEPRYIQFRNLMSSKKEENPYFKVKKSGLKCLCVIECPEKCLPSLWSVSIVKNGER